MNNLLKQRLWQISFQYDFDKLFSLLYQIFKSTLRLKKLGQNEWMNEWMNDRMTAKVLKTHPRVGTVSPITQEVWSQQAYSTHFAHAVCLSGLYFLCNAFNGVL